MDEVLAIEIHGLHKSDQATLPRQSLDVRAHKNLAPAGRENVGTKLLLDWQSRATAQSKDEENDVLRVRFTLGEKGRQ